MTPRERAVRLADLAARHQQAADAAEALRHEYEETWAVSELLNMGIRPDWVLSWGRADDPVTLRLAAVLEAQLREEEAIEQRLARAGT